MAVLAVCSEPCSGRDFPANRDINRESHNFRLDTRSVALSSRAFSMTCGQISLRAGAGNFLPRTGKLYSLFPQRTGKATTPRDRPRDRGPTLAPDRRRRLRWQVLRSTPDGLYYILSSDRTEPVRHLGLSPSPGVIGRSPEPGVIGLSCAAHDNVDLPDASRLPALRVSQSFSAAQASSPCVNNGPRQ